MCDGIAFCILLLIQVSLSSTQTFVVSLECTEMPFIAFIKMINVITYWDCCFPTGLFHNSAHCLPYYIMLYGVSKQKDPMLIKMF